MRSLSFWVILTTPFLLLLLARVMATYNVFPAGGPKSGYLFSDSEFHSTSLATLVGTEEILPKEEIRQTWLLITAAGAECGFANAQTVQFAERIEAAQGRNSEYISRVHINVGDRAVALESEDPRLEVAVGSNCPPIPASYIERESDLAEVTTAPVFRLEQGELWFTDPLGRFLLYFPQGSEGSDISRDVRKIMRAGGH